MRSSDGPSIHAKQACSPLKEDDENISRSVLHKKVKFKSPLSIAHPTQIENPTVSSSELSSETGSDGARKRVFGSDASNVQLPVESKNHLHIAQKKSKSSYDELSNVMPGFDGILEDIYQICPEAAVKIEPADAMSDREKHTAKQRECQDQEAEKTATNEVTLSGSLLEGNSDAEGEVASIDPQREISRLSANAVRSAAATNRSSVLSKFKMPARVSVCQAEDVSGTSPNVPGTAARPQLFRTPYRSSTIPISHGKANEIRSTVEEKIASDYYSVMYCIRKPNAKHKGPWADGALIRRGRSSILHDSEGKLVLKDSEQRGGALSEGATLFVMSQITLEQDLFLVLGYRMSFSVCLPCFALKRPKVIDDAMMQMGKYEVEVMRISTEEEILSGKIFQGTLDSPCEKIVKVVQRRPFKSFQTPPVKHARVSIHTDKVTTREVQTPKVKPALERDALLLNAKELQGDASQVFVDPYLASKLRPHQREGVKFMYECVMGLRDRNFTGCLLADAMGLGKTLQVIALIWTLIKQGPGGHPAVSRVLVICPSSLVENWGKEVRKWLGDERLPPIVIHSGTPAKDVKRKISNFQAGRVYHLLITSYELVRKHKDDLNAAKLGLLVCDEAHRLKNCAGNKTIDSLLELTCSKRLILTGTPIQNDLLEFYAMIDFVNPNLLGTLSTFKKLYANPIEKSRDRDASEDEKILGRARSAELQSITRFCILQRAANINAKYLPAKTEYVVFCMLQKSQVSIYQNFLTSKLVSQSLMTGQSAFALAAIGTLRKLCNHPMLVEHELSKGIGNITGVSSQIGDGKKAFAGQAKRRQDRTSADWRLSGKLSCLQGLLLAVHRSTTSGVRDKMVVVSNFTQTLDIIQIMCEGQGWRWLRLDGATNVSERQALVDRFNANDSDYSVFLLSSKAGGSGLNLIGANRLVLFDPDWNPATDAQAMARIWRDGQKKSVFIYRLLTTASIEEKIYQRQIMKGEVAAALVEQVEGHCLDGDAGGRRHFSREELRELFTLNLETTCDTSDLLSRSESSSSERWRDDSSKVEDHALQEAIQTGVVTFVHQKTCVKEVSPSLDYIHEGEYSKLDWDAKKFDVASVSPDAFVEQMDKQKSECSEHMSGPVHREPKDILESRDEHVPKNSSSSTSSKIESTAAQKILDAKMCEKDIHDKIFGVGLDGSGDESLAAKTLSTVSEGEKEFRPSWNARTHNVVNDMVDEVLGEYYEEAAIQDHCKRKNSVDLEDERIVTNSPSRAVSKIETNLKDKTDVSPNMNSGGISPAITQIAEEFDCLLESRSPLILTLMMNVPVPGDGLDEDELEDLDAPFLCSLDLEIEMKRASFAREDLWQGFKLFAIGFILEEKEEREAYRNSKLGTILNKCNPDKITDDQRIFCKAFPIVRGVLTKREGYRAADLSHLFSTFEREEHLKTTFSGRFTLALMRHFDRIQTKSDEQG